MCASARSAPGGSVELRVEALLTGDRQREAPGARAADHVLAGRVGPDPRVDLQRVRAVGQRALPGQRAAAALLGREHRAVGVEERGSRSDTSCSGAHERDALVRAHARGVGDLGVAQRRAQAVQRRDGVGREHRRAAAAERPRDGGVRAEHRDALERRRRERQQVALVAREHERRPPRIARSSPATSSSPHAAAGAPAPTRSEQRAGSPRSSRRAPPRARGRRGRRRRALAHERARRAGHREVQRASPAPTASRVANQSVMTRPSQPHSPLRISASIGLSVIVWPLTEL